MSFAVLLPLFFLLGLCLIPVWLLRRQYGTRAQDCCVAPGYTPPEVIRNSSIAKSLRLAAFGPLFVLGASGDFWPVIIASLSFGVGVYLVNLLRRPILEFLASALAGDRPVTVHAFIAQRHGGDARIRLLAASLTVFALAALIAGEAFALAGFLKLALGNELAARLLTLGALLLAGLYAFPAGHAGTMHSGQWHLEMTFLGLFGAAALLLYLHVSALTPLMGHGALAILFVAVCGLAMLVYRRSRYVETSPILPEMRSARLLGKAGKILNPVISVFVVLIVVLALMEFSAAGLAAALASVTALQHTSMPFISLIALALLPLFYPLADAANWQRLAAAEKNREFYQGDTARWLRALSGIFSLFAVETPLLWLFFAAFGALAALALAVPGEADAMQSVLQALASGDNAITAATLALLLLAVFGIVLPAMSSALSAAICTIRYDITPESEKAVSDSFAGRAFFLGVIVCLGIADVALPMSFTSSSFLALIVALSCPTLSFAPLILAPGVARAGWALLILGSGTVCSAAAVTGYLATGNDSWLWAAVPACLGLGFLLFAAARLSRRVRAG